MTKRHLFALNAPPNWPVKRKEQKLVMRPHPGQHSLQKCLPLGLLLKGVLNYAKTSREVKKILQNKEILVNNRVIKDQKFPVGVMDNIYIKSKNEYFRLFINANGKYELRPINKEEFKLKLCKIINKKILKKGITQLNLYDSRNINVDKDQYKTGDTIIINLENNKIVSHLKLEKGAFIYLTDGKYIGNTGEFESIIERKGLQTARISIRLDNKNIETLRDYAFVINQDTLKV